jgi:hypothetical protein
VTQDTRRHRCLCCSCWTLKEEPPGTFALCPVCGWEDDAFQAKHPDFSGGSNPVSLNTARRNFKLLGASDARRLTRTRRPTAEERGA